MQSKLSIFFKWLMKLMKKVAIVVVITLVVVFIISRYVDTNFARLLEKAGFVIMGIGAISVIGGTRSIGDVNYNLTIMTFDSEASLRERLELKLDSYKFTIFMGIAGVIILLISLALY